MSLVILGTILSSFVFQNECVSTLFFLLTSVKVLHVLVYMTKVSIDIIDLGLLNTGMIDEKYARNNLN